MIKMNEPQNYDFILSLKKAVSTPRNGFFRFHTEGSLKSPSNLIRHFFPLDKSPITLSNPAFIFINCQLHGFVTPRLSLKSRLSQWANQIEGQLLKAESWVTIGHNSCDKPRER
jgi:hypothetical protein